MALKKLKSDCREESGEGQDGEREDWDGLPLEVLNLIFNHLLVEDLLSCSVVSKNWKKASRDVLKRNRECYAYIKHFRQDVQSLNDMIVSTDLMQMINGLHIRVMPKNTARKPASSTSCEEDLNSKETRRRLEKAKRKFQAVFCGGWRFLNLHIGFFPEDVLSIDDTLLMRELISATSESLEKLVVGRDLDCDLITCCGKDFSKLKVLQIQDGQVVDDFYLEQYAPNLEEITGVMLPVKFHPPGNPFMLKRMKSILLVDPDVVVPEAGLMENFWSISGLYRLNVLLYRCRNSDHISILSSMVLRSLNTLEELHMDTFEFYKLVKASDQIKFPNLRLLSLCTYWRVPIEHEILALLQLNLPKLCPILEILGLLNECKGEYEEENISFEGPCGVEHSNLPLQIYLKCREQKYCHEHLKFLNQIYPNVNKVAVIQWAPSENPEMNSIFSELRSLEYMEIRVYLCPSYYSPDVAIAAILSGINIEEAKFLFSGLSRVNAVLNSCIVPIHPSIFNAKNLKELKITGEGNYTGDFVKQSWVIEITENVPVRHVRNLIVTFEGVEGLYNKLNDLRALKTLLCARKLDVL